MMQAYYRYRYSEENNTRCMLFLDGVGNQAQAVSQSVISDAPAAQALAEATSTCQRWSCSRHWQQAGSSLCHSASVSTDAAAHLGCWVGNFPTDNDKDPTPPRLWRPKLLELESVCRNNYGITTLFRMIRQDMAMKSLDREIGHQAAAAHRRFY